MGSQIGSTEVRQQTQQLARAELLWLLRDLLTPESAQSTARLTAFCEADSEVVEVAGLASTDFPTPLAAQLLYVVRQMLAVPTEERTAELLTWADAATGLDLCECAYIRRDRGAILGDIAGFYCAFGLQSVGDDLRPDQLTRELEFLGLLHVLHARALGEQATEGAEVTAQAAADFWQDHLGAWCALPAGRAEILPVPVWLHQALAVIAAVCAALAAASGWQPPAAVDGGAVDAEEPLALACGLA